MFVACCSLLCSNANQGEHETGDDEDETGEGEGGSDAGADGEGIYVRYYPKVSV